MAMPKHRSAPSARGEMTDMLPAHPTFADAGRVVSEATGQSSSQLAKAAIADLLSDPRWRSALRDEVLHRQMLQASADFVRSARNAAGMTQFQLAKALDVSQSRVAQLESGGGGPASPPGLLMLARVAQACGRRLVVSIEP